MRLVVVDAANCLYRAFFAVPPLRSTEGFPTGALHGFSNQLLKALREEKPTHMAVVFDAPGGSFRRELYPEYKANRDAQPEDLSAQFPVAREIVAAAGVPVLEIAGYEADDVIATLVARAPDDAEVVILSTDKDLMQLVGERVVLLDTMKDRRIDAADVEKRFGVPPAQVLDVRALVGDPSDNIPGVRGIGEKGAAKLIAEWETLDALLEHAGEVKAKRAREALEEQADEARLSRELATLRCDVPGCEDPTALALREPDAEALDALIGRLELKRLAELLSRDATEATEASEASAESAVDVEIVDDPESLAARVEELERAGRFAVRAIGADALGGLPGDPLALAFASSGESAVFALAGDALPVESLLSTLAPAFERGWGGRGTKRLQTLYAEYGLTLPIPAFDIELEAFLLDPAAQRTTQVLAAQHLDRSVQSYEELAGKGAKATPIEELPGESLAAWAAGEVCADFLLAERLRERLEKDELIPLLDDIELPLTAVLSGMERAGVRVDEDALERLHAEFKSSLEGIEARIYDLAGEEFQVGSPKQLQQILFEKLGLPATKKTKTGFSTDESVLEALAGQHELPGLVLAYRRLSKLVSTYVEALPPLVNEATGRIHPTFHQAGAATGRLSSSDPNVQNIPIRTEDGIRIREAFVPSEGGRLLSADYSQVELRILAHYSGDPSLREAFRVGEDIHRRTAAEVNGLDPEDVDDELRARAKAVNFGIIYGLSAFGLANQLGIPQSEAQRTIETYFARYLGVRQFLDDTIEGARERGYVRTLLGRRRYLPDLGSRNRAMRSAAERMAVNTVIQGTAADLMKKAMIEVAQGLVDEGLGAKMILQVHDELVFDAPEAELASLAELVRSRMEQVYALEVPLVVDVGSGAHWREAH